MAGIGRIISAAAFLILVAACGPRFDFVGTWKGERDRIGAPGADPVIVGNLNRVVLEIKSDGTFELFESGMPKSGNWSGGATARLDVTRVFTDPIDPAKPLVFRLVPQDPKRVMMESAEGNVILTREAQPAE